ncbi:TetR/AcrR family transcriptional regulator [Actinomycetospora endophytica]|uniref:TetR/AcrR family transcriptional regulator n=1 Tax=Actinomycetospora endophytica TaxID=2291215 RepID=A0ABS8P527_9PSEU|nr:TetR/AcrR family transcriptional regulator [Actinomycetospora endophytica]MCD2193362.1 TetR/AcrR family transcriptional regulator [Actinomycetospora endophytica]
MTESDDGLLLRISPHPPARDAGPARRDTSGRRAAIARAATDLFLRQGYQATSTEQVASAASVSKQTVYNQFGDKETLFREIVLGVTATAEAFAADLPSAMDGVPAGADLDAALRALARRYLTVVVTPQVLALRRLVISEAVRFPELAASYYERGPERVLAALGALFAGLGTRGLLRVTDPDRAAADFAFLLLGRTLDEGMFRPRTIAPAEIDAAADHAVDVFLAGCRS